MIQYQFMKRLVLFLKIIKKRRVEMNKTNAIGSKWKEVRKELFTQEEIHKSDERVAKISKIIEGQKKELQKGV